MNSKENDENKEEKENAGGGGARTYLTYLPQSSQSYQMRMDAPNEGEGTLGKRVDIFFLRTFTFKKWCWSHPQVNKTQVQTFHCFTHMKEEDVLQLEGELAPAFHYPVWLGVCVWDRV